MVKKIPDKIANIVYFALAAILLTYFFSKVDLSLFYHLHQPFFSKGVGFLKHYLYYAGGISEYIGLFLFQFYGNTGIALLLVLLQLAVWYFLVYLLIRKYVPTAFLPMPLTLSALPLIMSHGSYQFAPEISVAITLAAGFAVLYRYLDLRPLFKDLLYFLLGFLVYYTTDSMGLSVYLACTLPFSIVEKKYIFSFLSLAGLALLPFIGYLFDQQYSSLWEAYRGHFITGSREFITVLINSTSVIIFVLLFLCLYSKKLFIITSNKEWFVYANFVVMLPLLFFIAFKITYNPTYKKIIQIDRLAYEKKWDTLLKTVDMNLVQKKPILSQVNRALYHKGMLLDYLFFYPQEYCQDALIIQGPAEASITMPLSDIYYDLGLINEARHWANEALTMLGNQPRILERLVKTYIITGQYNTSEKYLNILESSHITDSWAKRYRKYLDCDECVNKDPELGQLRKMNPSMDFFAAIENPYDNLKHLVADSIPNRMAFEYFIAWKLLTNMPGDVLNIIPRFSSMGYTRLPRACQEAVLIYQATKGVTSLNSIGGYPIDKAIKSSFEDFSGILFGRFKGDVAAAKNSLNKFNQTYWYYYLYSGPVKSSVRNTGSFSQKY